MHPIDEVERIKRDGFLTYFRSDGQRGSPDQEQVVESVSVTLRTPTDPIDRCVAYVRIEWVPHFVNAALAPRLKAEADSVKMLALYPEILAPFFAMSHGSLSPDAFVDGLRKMGVKQDGGNREYMPRARTCIRCTGLFAPEDCNIHSVDPFGYICAYCSMDQQPKGKTCG